MSFTASSRALEYLEDQPGTVLVKLHQQPSTALAIFRRMLPHLAKTIVMSMLYMPHPLSLVDLDSWIDSSSESSDAKDRALNVLQRLKILKEEANPGQIVYQMSRTFAHSLRLALTGGGPHNSFGVPCVTADTKPVDIDFLDSFARQQWEAILYYVVGSANTGLRGQTDISAATKTLLQSGEFVTVRAHQALITQKGFTFLLQEINAQIWQLLITYLELSEKLQMDAVEMLSFMFTLGSLELGVDYSTTNLTQTQEKMLVDLTHFGLVYQHSETSTRYYPTRLATTLTSDSPALPNSSLTSTTVGNIASSGGMPADEKGFIIVETNYRLYAYTNSPLLISILSLFCQLHTRYPNLVTGKITKSSVQTAISRGITSDQIIAYLTTHAHPILRKQQPVLPPTVVDQIRLWQIEGERMTAWDGCMIKDFNNPEDFDKAVQYAEALGILVREFRSKRCFFVTSTAQLQLYFAAQTARRKKAKEEAEAVAKAAGSGQGTTTA